MPFYLIRIRYSPSSLMKLLFGEGNLFKCFYDLSEEDIRGIREAQKKDITFELYGEHIVSSRIIAINVYRTDKSIKELSTCYDGQTELVRKNILDGKIGENVTGLFFPPSPLHEDKPLTINDLLGSVQSFGLDNNWFTATCALQLQEVVIVLLAEKKGIMLDKASVEKILELKRPIEGELPFSQRYEAFSKEVKRLFHVDMPEMLMDMRKVRRKVLHEGKNPTPEEVDSIVTFTIGLLKKLNALFSD